MTDALPSMEKVLKTVNLYQADAVGWPTVKAEVRAWAQAVVEKIECKQPRANGDDCRVAFSHPKHEPDVWWCDRCRILAALGDD